MRKMTVKQARKVRDALMIGGTIIVLLAYFWKPFVCASNFTEMRESIVSIAGNNLMTKFKIYRTDKISSETKRHVSVRCYRESRVPDRIIWP